MSIPVYKIELGEIETKEDVSDNEKKKLDNTIKKTEMELLTGIKTAQEAGMQVYADVMFNQKLGADESEKFKATPFNPQNRKESIGELQEIEAWTQFNLPGRIDTYAELKWHRWHFKAADFNALEDESDAIYLFERKIFDGNVDLSNGNYDYLMDCTLDINNPDMQKDLFHWGELFLETTGVDGRKNMETGSPETTC